MTATGERVKQHPSYFAGVLALAFEHMALAFAAASISADGIPTPALVKLDCAGAD